MGEFRMSLSHRLILLNSFGVRYPGMVKKLWMVGGLIEKIMKEGSFVKRTTRSAQAQ